MPEACDGFAVVTVMRHTQPTVLTLVGSDFPDVQRAMHSILLQADEVATKPFDVLRLVGLLQKRSRAASLAARTAKEDVASVLERDLAPLLQRWLTRVEQVRELAALALAPPERTANLPEIVKNIPARLREVRLIEAVDRPSPAAMQLGQTRYRQGYSAPLVVQECRLLVVAQFEFPQGSPSALDTIAASIAVGRTVGAGSKAHISEIDHGAVARPDSIAGVTRSVE
jgi:hypothetical protein